MGHCPSEKLVKHFYEFVEKVGLDVKYMVHLRMDGPNVNKTFQSLLLTSDSLGKTSFLDIGTCTLHIVHNAFRNGVSSLKFDVDQFALDIHFFFKLSAGRRADYDKISDITDVVAQYALKHSTTRWVTLRKVLVRLIEQYKNIKEYFLSFLPTTSTFKSTVQETPRYNRIKKALNDEITLQYLSFVVFFATDSEVFLTKFQSKKPHIHILYDEMEKLLWQTMSKFIKTKQLSSQKEDGSTKQTSATELIWLDVYNKKLIKPIKMVDIGTKAKSLFPPSTFDLSETEESFRKDCLNCMQVTSKHLQKKLPLNSFFLNCGYLQLRKKNSKGALEGITNIAQDLTKALSEVLGNVFPGKTSSEEVCDSIRSEWRLYQTEVTKEEDFVFSNTTSCGRKQWSYWENAFEIAGLNKISENDSLPVFDIEKLVLHLGKLFDSSDTVKFPTLTALMKCVLSMSHGNSAPEGGFSINKQILDVHGNSLKADTIEALRVVKDAILRYPSICDIPITREMLKFVKSSRQRYQADLEAKRLLAQKEELKKKEEKQKQKEEEEQAALRKQNEKEVETIKAALLQIKNGLSVADESVEEGNKNFKDLLSKKNSTRKDLQRAQSKIEMGLKRRAELSAEEEVLKKKLKELEDE